MLRQFANALFAINREEDGSHQSHECLICTDVRSSLLAANVLLACRQRQAETAIAFAIHSLANQASRHLAQILLLRCDHPAERAAITERHAEGLRLHADDIRLHRGPNDAERNRLCNRHNQQRAFFMCNLCNSRNVLNHAEEVGALHQHCRGFFCHLRFKPRQIDATGLRVVTNQRRGQSLMLRVGGHHLAIFGMHGFRYHSLVTPGHADRHHHRFGRSR